MPTFIELRADYPLILTLLEHASHCALTWFYIAGFTSARMIPFPLIRQNCPVPVSLYTVPSANFCSSASAPTASGSTWGLTLAHASLRQLQSHIDEQLMPPAEYHRATLRSSTEFDFRESAASLLAKSAESAVIAVTRGCASFANGIRRKERSRFCRHSVAYLFSDRRGKSGQIKEEDIMSQSRGAVSFEPLFTAEDIGLRKEANVEHVMKVFITLGEGQASRWIEMPKGVLLLQTVPDEPASGAIYLYDRELQVFYFVVFDLGRDDSLTAAEFDELVMEYNLVSWTAHPALFRRGVAKHPMA
jgi:hypothetical protein